jgi:XTP/dITP diphosphohydrolase
MPEPVEDADTFLGNAELKAAAYSLLAPGLMVMADDSGLEVEALGGEPGVRSARFAEDAGFTDGATKDERNNALLLRRLSGVRDRGGRFVCALAVARDGVVVWRASGACEGVILEEARGVDGFGYDPLFLVPSLGRTMAELSREEKWGVSHRGQAFRGLLAGIEKEVAKESR